MRKISVVNGRKLKHWINVRENRSSLDKDLSPALYSDAMKRPTFTTKEYGRFRQRNI